MSASRTSHCVIAMSPLGNAMEFNIFTVNNSKTVLEEMELPIKSAARQRCYQLETAMYYIRGQTESFHSSGIENS